MKNFNKKMYGISMFLLINSMNFSYGDSRECIENSDCNSCQPACCNSWFVSADFLYWRTFESGLDICTPCVVSDFINADGVLVSQFCGRGQDLHFGWDPGFRIGIGYDLPCSDWDLSVYWTHFYSKAQNNTHANEIHLNVNYNVIDLVARYECDLNNCFSLNPLLGLRGAKIHQNLHMASDPNATCDSEVSNFTNINNSKQKFFGVGPLLGLEAEWNMGCNFSFYTDIAISWLYGNFDVNFAGSNEFPGAISRYNVCKHLNANLAVTDAGLGIRWQTCFCTNRILMLELGLEHHRYFDYNRFGCSGDLSFDGVNFSAGFEF